MMKLILVFLAVCVAVSYACDCVPYTEHPFCRSKNVVLAKILAGPYTPDGRNPDDFIFPNVYEGVVKYQVEIIHRFKGPNTPILSVETPYLNFHCGIYFTHDYWVIYGDVTDGVLGTNSCSATELFQYVDVAALLKGYPCPSAA